MKGSFRPEAYIELIRNWDIGFTDGVPGICDECFKQQKPSEKIYCEHDKL